MSRERLTSKSAGEYDNDVYKNESRTEGDINPVKKYENGNPSTWAEDPDKRDPAKDDDKRNEMNVGDIRNANEEHIKSARELEHRAVKCIVASQRMLPGMDEKSVEANALDLMHLPTASVDAILSRQEKLAQSLQTAAEEVTEEEKEEKEAGKLPEALQKAIDEKKEEKEAGEEVPAEEKSEEEAPAEKEAGEDRIASLESKLAHITALLEKKAGEEKEEEKEEEAPAEEAKEAGEEKEEEAPAEEAKEASDESMLDSIFSSVTASDEKAGATRLTGMVSKQASSKEDVLGGIWKGAPDVSGNF